MQKPIFTAVTTAHLAEICGVSQGTVDRALHNRPGINPHTRERVLAAAERYGYVPNIHAQALSGGRSMLLGIVIPDLNNDYFSRLVMELEQLCRAAGYASVLMLSHKKTETEIDCLKRLAQIGVDGIVLCPMGQGADYISFLRTLHAPVIAVGNRLPGVAFAGINDFAAMQTLTARLIERGYTELYYYAPVLTRRNTVNTDAQIQRFAGFTATTTNAAVTTALLDDHILRQTLTSSVPEHQRTVIICPSDVYALYVRSVLAELHRTDIGLCGFDDIRLLTQCGIPLSSVGVDDHAVAQAAVDFILHGTVPHEISFYIAERGSF